MTDVLVIVLAVVVVVLLVVVLLQSRSTAARASIQTFDESKLKQLLDQALADGGRSAGRHAEDPPDPARDQPAGQPFAGERSAESQSVGERSGSERPGSEHSASEQAGSLQIAELRRELGIVREQLDAATGAAALSARTAEQAAQRTAEQAARTGKADGRREAEQALAGAKATVERERAALADSKTRLVDEATAVLAAERAELQTAQHRMRSSLETLADDQRRLASDRERVRADESEVSRAWAKVTGKEDALRLEAEQLSELSEQVADRTKELDERSAGIETELVRVSGLTAEAARADLLGRQQKVVRRESALMVRRIEAEAESTAKQRARAIVADAIQRVASDQTAQTVVSVVHLPADELKGRIIGREGRNIRAFETVTGVNVIIDDTPEAVLLSCFDPVRREVGRVTLEMLIEDGRIHPHRIEEAYDRAHDEVEALCARAAEDAMLDVGISGLHPELVTLLGHLKYRTSYGQNVLGHLVETAHIARAMAAELGIDPAVAARGAFLHDIGKALTHEAQGSHAAVGAELARRYGESDEVAHCIEAHHDEVPPSTVEAVLTQAADACSGGRPGARRESLESYVQRLERIEAIAAGKKGVEKVFAMQAGRELRVMVKPDVIDDLEAHVLAREVAKQIEEELTYPGQVRVTVIRESRATEVAR